MISVWSYLFVTLLMYVEFPWGLQAARSTSHSGFCCGLSHFAVVDPNERDCIEEAGSHNSLMASSHYRSLNTYNVHSINYNFVTFV